MTSETGSVLSRIVTDWKLIEQAQAEGPDAGRARNELLERYHQAVIRYLQRKLPEYEACMLASNFALAILECDNFLRLADQEHGMFRRYLQRALKFKVIDLMRQKARQANKEIAVEFEVPVHDEPEDRESPAEAELNSVVQTCLDRSLAELLKALRGSSLKRWREHLVARVLKLLADQEAAGGPPYHSLIQLKAEQPDLGGKELAEALSARVGRTISPTNLRQLAHRQRERYAELLIEELARSLELATKKRPTRAVLEEKLIEMELLNVYAREALEQYAEE